MKVVFATDHAGFKLKEHLVAFVEGLGHEVVDVGAHEYKMDDDYPDYIAKAAKMVSEGQADRGIVLGGSGQGEDIVADKFNNVRSVVYYGGPMEIVKLSREHNDANVLSLGARFIDESQAEKAVALWLQTLFSGVERHQRRLDKIDQIESEESV